MDPQCELLSARLSRRCFLRGVGTGVLAGLVASAAPVARAAPSAAVAQHPAPDATLQAFADTIVPGRRASVTDLGNAIHPGAIAGVDSLPGAVEADALALFHSPFIGFDTLQEVFLADLEARALRLQRGPFLALPYAGRAEVALEGLDFENAGRVLYETAAAIAWSAFSVAAANPFQTADRASGYRVMGYPGAAPRGYRDAGYSYRRELSRERTRTGYLP